MPVGNKLHIKTIKVNQNISFFLFIYLTLGTLDELVPAFIKSRAATVSEQTVEVWRQSELSLYRFFGGDRKVDTIPVFRDAAIPVAV